MSVGVPPRHRKSSAPSGTFVPIAEVRETLTKTVVDNAEVRGERYWIWDSELAGFGLRVEASGTKTFKNS